MQRTIDVRSSTACAFAIAVVGSSACQPAVTADAGTDAPVAPACPIDGPVVEHGNTITADETWAAGRHLVTFDVSVRMGATLTIAPCATVRVRTRYGIDVLTGGTLVADGTALQPIRFEPETAGQPWRQIQVSQGQARLAYVTLEAGGEVANDPLSAALWLRGDNASSMAQPLVRVRHVTIRNATKYGVRLEANATFSADSADLTITGAGQFPVLSLPGSVGSVPSGLYTGNAVDEMLVLAGAIEWDMTLADRGVPYHIGRPGLADNSFRVMGMGTAVPLLTIEAGVTMRFERRAEIAIEHFTADVPAHGALHAIGTAARPVRFTSAAVNPAAGD